MRFTLLCVDIMEVRIYGRRNSCKRWKIEKRHTAIVIYACILLSIMNLFRSFRCWNIYSECGAPSVRRARSHVFWLYRKHVSSLQFGCEHICVEDVEYYCAILEKYKLSFTPHRNFLNPCYTYAVHKHDRQSFSFKWFIYLDSSIVTQFP